MIQDPYPRDSRFRLTENDIDLLASAIIEAAGGVPKADAPKVVYDKLLLYKTVLEKRNKGKGAKSFIRTFLMEDRSVKIGEVAEFTDNSIVIKKEKEVVMLPSGDEETCPNKGNCLLQTHSCTRQNGVCPDAISKGEVDHMTQRKVITSGKDKGKEVPSRYDNFLSNLLKEGK